MTLSSHRTAASRGQTLLSFFFFSPGVEEAFHSVCPRRVLPFFFFLCCSLCALLPLEDRPCFFSPGVEEAFHSVCPPCVLFFFFPLLQPLCTSSLGSSRVLGLFFCACACFCACKGQSHPFHHFLHPPAAPLWVAAVRLTGLAGWCTCTAVHVCSEACDVLAVSVFSLQTFSTAVHVAWLSFLKFTSALVSCWVFSGVSVSLHVQLQA